MSGQKAREIAARVLTNRPVGAFIEDLLDRALAGANLASNDRGLCQELVYGVVRWEGTLDWLIRSKTPGRTQKAGLQVLLRLGLYQIFWLDRIPDHAAVNESVNLTRQLGFGAQAGFVNALLRGFLREKEATRKVLFELQQTDPATGFSHPAWLTERWIARFGRENTQRLLEWNNTPPRIFGRVNTLKAAAEEVLAQWREEGVEYDPVGKDWLEENLIFELKSHPPLAGMASFAQGKFYVQDPSTLLAVQRLDPQPGQKILDLCAAPGGKLTFIAQQTRNRAQLVALDPDPDRLRLVRENCGRLGVGPVETGRSADGLPPGTFDRVLLDAPCSNTGVMRRRVDLRWRVRPEEIEALKKVQLELLSEAVSLVKPGGYLVYSTCSLEPQENGDLVQQFLAQTPGCSLESERQLLPFQDGVDGAYVARLLKAQG